MSALPSSLPIKRPLGERIVSGGLLDDVAELRTTLDPPQSVLGEVDELDPGWDRVAAPRPEDGPQTGLSNPPAPSGTTEDGSV